MNTVNRAANRTLAIALSLAMLLPVPGSAASMGAARVVPVERPVIAGAAGVMAVTLKLPISPAPMGGASLSGAIQPLASAPSLNPVMAPSASAVSAHPVVDMINKLQASGVALPESGDNAQNAAQILAAAEALPAGAARDNLVTMARTLTAPKGGQAELGRVFDASAQQKAAEETPSSETDSVRMMGWLQERSWMPTGLRRSLGKRIEAAAAKQEAARPKAEPKQYQPLDAAKARWTAPAQSLPVSTRDVAMGDSQVVGQDAALKALYFGLKMPGEHYNLYVSGPDGSGRATAVRHTLEKLAPTMPTPNDLVSVTNFADEDKPLILETAPGQAAKLEAAVMGFVRTVQKMLPQVFASGNVAGAKKEMHDEYEAAAAQRQSAFTEKVAALRVGRFGMQIQQQQGEEGVKVFIAPTLNGEVLTDAQVEAKIAAGEFTREDWDQAKEQMVAKAQPLLAEMQAMLEAGQEEHGAVHQKMAQLEAQAAQAVIGQVGKSLKSAVSQSQDGPEMQALERRMQQRQAAVDAQVAQVRIGKFGLYMQPVRTGKGVKLAVALTIEGTPITPDTAAQLIGGGKFTEAEFSAAQSQLKAKAQPLMEAFTAMMKQNQDDLSAVRASQKPVVETAASRKVQAWVDQLVSSAAQDYQTFLPKAETPEGAPKKMGKSDPADNFRVNVLVDNAVVKGAPIVWEKNPSYENLFGSADANAQTVLIPGAGLVKTKGDGGPTLKAGSYLKANGGFLVLNVMDVLREPGSWQALMAAVRNGDAEIAEGGLQGMASMKGEKYHVPAKVKIVLIGSPMMRRLLAHHDEDFGRSFNAAVDFEPSLKINDQSIAGYLHFLKKAVVTSGGEIMDLTQGAIGAVLEISARIVDSNSKLSSQFGALYTLLREASFYAKEAGSAEVRSQDINTALAGRGERENVYQRHMMDMYTQNIFTVATSGKVVGQINGLAVMGAFGVPMRITITAGPGAPGVVSVDRDAGSTGTSFNKALGVVEGFLQNTFGQKKPMSAKIRISFEQNYGGIDGDSATSTEIYGILSRLSDTPLRQDAAVTGSSDQFGTVQAIGGVNEKIEGFFMLLRARNQLNTENPPVIIIPATNVGDLQLSPDIVEAMREDPKTGKKASFRVHPVSHVSEGLEILTGVAYSEIVRKASMRLAEMRRGAMTP